MKGPWGRSSFSLFKEQNGRLAWPAQNEPKVGKCRKQVEEVGEDKSYGVS